MKVIGVNGSPKSDGNTFLTIKAFCDELQKEGIDSEIIHPGDGKISGCVSCMGCVGVGECAVKCEQLAKFSRNLLNADGVFLAAPAYFGTMPGQMKSFLDRFFFPCIQTGKMRHKVGAAAAILRRTGGYTTIDDLNRVFFAGEMISVGQAIIHGTFPGEVLQDIEGLAIIGQIARNMAWVLKMQAATKSDIIPPPYEKKPFMNFIR